MKTWIVHDAHGMLIGEFEADEFEVEHGCLTLFNDEGGGDMESLFAWAPHRWGSIQEDKQHGS